MRSHERRPTLVCSRRRPRVHSAGAAEPGSVGHTVQISKREDILRSGADQWRTWLNEHHDSESEVWLIFHKVHTGVKSLAYSDTLDEALCFGWVDSLVKRLDESRYALKFTPRRADSRWSTINRERYAALKAAGRLKPMESIALRPTAAMVRDGHGSNCPTPFHGTFRQR